MNHRISHNTLVAGGIAAALLMLWFVTSGDTATAARMRSDPGALRLLRDAAGAAQRTAYQGVRFITAWSRGGTAATSLVNVVHIPGEGTQLRVQSTTADQGGAMFEADGAEQSPGGLTGYTPRMLELLARNYAVVQAGQSAVCGRRVTIVEAHRADGTAAGRFYIDPQTGLMLRRELLDSQAREVNLAAFTELNLSMAASRVVLAATPHTVEAPWTHELAATDLGTLHGEGWPVQSTLPGRLNLYDARQRDGGAPVVHLGYSDGLSAVSVFVQRGTLDPRSVAGWRKTTSHGRLVYRHDTMQQRAVWEGRGYVYTVVADAPPEVVDRAVDALPHGRLGFWSRLARGLDRMTSWANPFD